MTGHAIVMFIVISILFLLVKFFLQYRCTVDDVAMYIPQSPESFVVVWKYSSVRVNIHLSAKTQHVSSSIGTTCPWFIQPFLKNAGPLLKSKEGTKYKQKK